MAARHLAPDLALSAMGIELIADRDGPVFGSLETRPLPALPCGVAYAGLSYHHGVRAEELETLGLPLPEAVSSASPKRKVEHLAGRLCARAAVHQLTGRFSNIERAASGAPLWPAGLTGSISHSQGRALAVAGRVEEWGSLGVDMETEIPTGTASELAPLILTASERRRFAAIIEPGFLTMAFSVKEAIFKAVHPLVHCFFDHQGAEILDYDSGGTLSLQLAQNLSDEWQLGRRVSGRFWRMTDRWITLAWTGAPDRTGPAI